MCCLIFGWFSGSHWPWLVQNLRLTLKHRNLAPIEVLMCTKLLLASVEF